MISLWSRHSGLKLLPFVILGFLIYSNTLEVPFYLDDFSSIVQNRHIRLTNLSLKDAANVGLASRGYSNRPVANVSFALNYYFHQDNVAGYHLVNIFIHITTGLLIYLLTKNTLCISMKQSGQFPNSSTPQFFTPSTLAFFSALVWFVHPIQTQSVTYIVQRMNSLAAMFYVLSLWLYVRGRLAKQDQRGWPWFGASILAGTLAMGSKEIAATLPFFVLLYEWYFFQDLSKAWLKRHGAFISGILIVFGLLVFLYLEPNPLRAILSDYEHLNFTLTERVLTQFRVVVYYVSLLAFPLPSRLNLNHDFPLSYSIVDPITTLVSMGAIAGLICLAFCTARRQRFISFCIFWFFGNLVIESSIIPLDLIFEHRVYLPSMLFFPAIVVAGCRYIRRPSAIVGILSALVVLFSLWTYKRNDIWKNPVAFWKDSVDKAENSGRSLINLGLALAREGKLDEAVSCYSKALRFNPNYAPAHNNLGMALADQGNLNEAIAHYTKALQIRADYPEAHINLGNALSRQGNLDQAVAHYSQAPQYEEAHSGLGRIFTEQGKLDEAIAHFSEALRINSNYADAHCNLGLVLAQTGKLHEAIAHFTEALRINPDYAEAHYNLGVALAAQGNLNEAMAHYSEALQIKPDYAEAHNNLGILLGQAGELDEAVGHFSKALQVKPDFLEARVNLQHALKKMGRFGKTMDSGAAPFHNMTP